MKPMIINDGIDYYVIETINASIAKETQENLKNGDSTNFAPIYKFTFLDDFKKEFLMYK